MFGMSKRATKINIMIDELGIAIFSAILENYTINILLYRSVTDIIEIEDRSIHDLVIKTHYRSIGDIIIVTQYWPISEISINYFTNVGQVVE